MVVINYQKKSEEMSAFIKATVEEAGFQKVIVALSGGVDSAVSCALAVKALSAKNVLVVILPYGELSKDGLQDATLVIESLKIPEENVFEIDIKSAVDIVWLHALKDLTDISNSPRHKNEMASSFVSLTSRNDEVRQGNIMARVRMIYLFDLAKRHAALVLGTENKTEHLLGYFTRFGDEASDIEPIRSLYKTQIWEMAKYLQLPEQVIIKAPTAGLWQNQTDESEFGFNYLDADKILFGQYEEYLKAEEIAKKYNLSSEIVEKVLAWSKKNDFKHHLPKIYG